MAFWRMRQQIGLAAIIVSGGILLSRFMGLFRDKLISLLFGATLESDLYFAAFVVPDFINYMLAGGYFSVTLIPFLTRYFEADEEDGWKFFSTVFLWVAVSVCALTIIGFIFAHDLARIAAPGLSPEALLRLAFFLRIILPAQIFFLCGSCLSAILFMRKQFFVPATVSIVYNLFIIIGGILLRARGMEGFCWGVLAGSVIGNFLLPLLAVRSGGGFKIRFSAYHPGIGKYILVALPLMIGQSITVVDEQFIRIFGSFAGPGVISWLSYARRIMMVPVSVVAQAAGVASYPFLAELFSKNDFSRFHKTINSALQNVMTLLIPLSIYMALVAEPTIRLIFQQGRFGVSDTFQTARLLEILLVCVPFWGYQQVLVRAFYSRLDMIWPTVLGTCVTILMVPVYYFLATRKGALGIALASAGSIFCFSALLTYRWKSKSGSEVFSGLLAGAVKVLIISVVCALPAWAAGMANPFDARFSPYLSALAAIFFTGLSFGCLFAFLSGYFIPDLARPFLERIGPIGRKLLRERGRAAERA
jgi:putative peptidoglycan lipid II flippase